jgi:hypothetical protein
VQGADEYDSIPLDKGRLVPLAILSIVLVASSAWLFLNPNQGQYNPAYLEVAALAGVALFGFGGVYSLTMLFDERPGLILDHLGLIDNSSALAPGRIAWSEVRDIKVYSVLRRRFLVLIVANPERFFIKGNLVTQFFAHANHRLTGSPITIPSAVLDVGFAELEQRVRKFWSRFRNENGTGLPARPTDAPRFGGRVRTAL